MTKWRLVITKGDNSCDLNDNWRISGISGFLNGMDRLTMAAFSCLVLVPIQVIGLLSSPVPEIVEIPMEIKTGPLNSVNHRYLFQEGKLYFLGKNQTQPGRLLRFTSWDVSIYNLDLSLNLWSLIVNQISFQIKWSPYVTIKTNKIDGDLHWGPMIRLLLEIMNYSGSLVSYQRNVEMDIGIINKTTKLYQGGFMKHLEQGDSDLVVTPIPFSFTHLFTSMNITAPLGTCYMISILGAKFPMRRPLFNFVHIFSFEVSHDQDQC